ncbi:MAG TPA: TonB-dependent receptor [Stellaceae bacterium]|nr:TonB-dependent receptor [Stellaceae bacterium]
MSRSMRVTGVRSMGALLFSLLSGWFAGSPARADDTTLAQMSLPPVVISATLLPTPASEIGSSVTVITAADIAQTQARTLPDVLNDVPGLNVVQAGGPGSLTQVYIRGADANHTKVLIDGIDVSDPSSPDGSFDFSQLLASDIARIEILRGPASGLYGSDAIGGVIDIITKTGSGPPQVHGSIEGGSFDTFNQTAGVSGSTGRFSYDFDVAHFHSGDTDVTPSGLLVPGRPLNPDYDDNKTVSTKLGAQLTDNLDVGVVARYVDTDLNSTSDDFLGPEAASSYSDNHELFTRAFAHLVSFGGVFDETVGIAYTDYHRRFLDPNPDDIALGNDPADYNGSRTKLDWRGIVKLMPGEVLVLGAEHELDRLDDSTPVSAHVTNDAGYAELQSSFDRRLFNSLSLRYDENGSFGGHPTFREAPAYLIPETGTKLKGSVGTGFKAPTLDELYDNYPQYDFFANPALTPETSLGYDAGFEQSLWDKRVEFGSTYFHNDISNLIEINQTGTSYANIGRATTYGAENYLSWRPWRALTLRLDYTYTMANDDITHTELVRRPKHKASLNARWQATARLSFAATVLYVGAWSDINRSGTASGLTATPYTLINLAGSYDLGRGISLFARIDNLLNRHYQDPIGFQHQGLGVFGGMKVAFDAGDLGR